MVAMPQLTHRPYWNVKTIWGWSWAGESQHMYQGKHVLLVGLEVSAVREGHTFHPPPQPPASSAWKVCGKCVENACSEQEVKQNV